MESFYIGHIGPSFLRDIHHTFTAEGAEYAEFFSSYIYHTFTAEYAESAENFFKVILTRIFIIYSPQRAQSTLSFFQVIFDAHVKSPFHMDLGI